MTNTIGATLERNRINDEVRFLKMRAIGKTVAEIARRNRVSVKFVVRVLERAARRDDVEDEHADAVAESYRRKLRRRLDETDDLAAKIEPADDSDRGRAWLRLRREGHRVSAISEVFGVPVRVVQSAVFEAAAAELVAEIPPACLDEPTFASPPEKRLHPFFPVGYLTPTSACPHRDEYPEGPDDYCVVCCRAGRDRGAINHHLGVAI